MAPCSGRVGLPICICGQIALLGEWEPPTGCERAGTQVRPATAAFHAEAMRLTQLRLRSVGLLAEEGPARPWARAGLEGVLQALRLRQRRERLERVVLDLTDPLAGDAEGAPHLLERSRLAIVKAEAKHDHLALAFG